MKKNMGSADSVLRILVAFIIAGLYFAKLLSGTAAVILLIIAGVFILTSLLGYCPLYSLFGFSTRKKADKVEL
jgi:hypothetical protein